jgi:hypothetical protein
MPEAIFMKLRLDIMAFETVSSDTSKPLPFSLYVCLLPTDAIQRLNKHVPAAINTCNNRITAKRVVFYAVRVISKDSLWIYVPFP